MKDMDKDEDFCLETKIIMRKSDESIDYSVIVKNKRKEQIKVYGKLNIWYFLFLFARGIVNRTALGIMSVKRTFPGSPQKT